MRYRESSSCRVRSSNAPFGIILYNSSYAGISSLLREDSDSGTEVYYILTDHLGSTTLTYRSSDGHVETQKYKPLRFTQGRLWGETRQVTGQLPTERTFQGQRDSGWGLIHFGARWFDSALGRFAQADSIIPGTGNPLAWDRYAGLGNNPVRYTDPSGHRPACEDTDDPACAEVIYTLDEIAGQYGISFDGSWTKKEKAVILTGAYFIGKATNRVLTKPLSYASAFRKAHGNKTQFYKSTSAGSTCGAGTDTVTCDSGVALTPQLVAHELGHVFSWEYGGDPYEDLGNAALMDNEDNWITGTHPGGDFERTTSGYKGEGPPYMYHGPIEWDDWNSNTNNTARNEDYADMYMNWVFDTFDYFGTSLGAGKVRYDWMTTNVAEYVGR